MSPSTPRQQLAARLPLHILVADDNLVNRTVMLRLLSQLGYQADLAENGREVIAALERRHYDIVLMDVQMPELDGLETTRLIHQRWVRGSRPRIIAITANDLPEDRESCLRVGMDGYLVKPLQIDTLQAMLVHWGNSLLSEGTHGDIAAAANDEFASLLQLRAAYPEGESDIVSELIDLFLEDTPVRLGALRQAIRQSADRTLAQAGHSLKGSCAMMGAKHMAELCAELERLGHTNALGGAEVLLNALESEFTRVSLVLARLRRGS